jgi:YHS domain-containing protein
MSSFIRKLMTVTVVLGAGAFSLYASDQTSASAGTMPAGHMAMTGNHPDHDSTAVASSQNSGVNTKPVETAKLAVQTTCPVMGGAIDKNVHVDYKGKRVYFCCTMCPPTFNKDPETYIKKLEALGQGVETIVTAPNGKKTVSKDTTTMKMDKSTPTKGMDHSKM